MYLEISGRRTGKTQRLIKEVYNCVLNYNSIAVVFTFNANVIKIEHFSNFDDTVKIFSTTDQYLRWLNHYTGGKVIRLFYGEFDSKNDVILDIHGYYVTTPFKLKYTKLDVLPELIRLNNNTYIRNINTDLIKELYKSSDIDKEMLANFTIV